LAAIQTSFPRACSSDGIQGPQVGWLALASGDGVATIRMRGGSLQMSCDGSTAGAAIPARCCTLDRRD
jgi:hypothetical protein